MSIPQLPKLIPIPLTIAFIKRMLHLPTHSMTKVALRPEHQRPNQLMRFRRSLHLEHRVYLMINRYGFLAGSLEIEWIRFQVDGFEFLPRLRITKVLGGVELWNRNQWLNLGEVHNWTLNVFYFEMVEIHFDLLII